MPTVKVYNPVCVCDTVVGVERESMSVALTAQGAVEGDFNVWLLELGLHPAGSKIHAATIKKITEGAARCAPEAAEYFVAAVARSLVDTPTTVSHTHTHRIVYSHSRQSFMGRSWVRQTSFQSS